jgi:hypothetical protein
MTVFDWVSLITLIVWLFLEIPRLSYGMQGNINELFPEMFAFLIFSTIFAFPLSACMFNYERQGKYPHEFVTALIQILFLFVEIITSLVVLYE